MNDSVSTHPQVTKIRKQSEFYSCELSHGSPLMQTNFAIKTTHLASLLKMLSQMYSVVTSYEIRNIIMCPFNSDFMKRFLLVQNTPVTDKRYLIAVKSACSQFQKGIRGTPSISALEVMALMATILKVCKTLDVYYSSVLVFI